MLFIPAKNDEGINFFHQACNMLWIPARIDGIISCLIQILYRSGHSSIRTFRYPFDTSISRTGVFHRLR